MLDSTYAGCKWERRGDGGDGGVECLARRSTGGAIGWQAKFFVNGIGDGQISRIKESFATALKTYVDLRMYIVAVPVDPSGSGVDKKADERKRWNRFVLWAKGEAAAQSRFVDIELWGETELLRRLSVSGMHRAGLTR
jgi:hypothetical protein